MSYGDVVEAYWSLRFCLSRAELLRARAGLLARDEREQ